MNYETMKQPPGTYRIEHDGKTVIKHMARTWCQGYVDRIADEWPPRNRWTIVRESDGKVVYELPPWDQVSVGQIAGHPTAAQYRRAAAEAIRVFKVTEPEPDA